jgi:hypothetical protein
MERASQVCGWRAPHTPNRLHLPFIVASSQNRISLWIDVHPRRIIENVLDKQPWMMPVPACACWTGGLPDVL